MKKQCWDCVKPIGCRSKWYCDYHAGYHAGIQSKKMAAKRAADPAYREMERQSVKKRMQVLRAKRREAGRGQEGKSYG